MSVGWRELGPNGQAMAETVFTVLDQTAELGDLDHDDEVPPSPSALWAWVSEGSGGEERLARAMLRYPSIRDTVAAILDRAAIVALPRIAAAATDERIVQRIGDGAVIRLVPSQASADQIYVMIALDDSDAAPSRLMVTAGDTVVAQALDEPVEGTVQILTEGNSDLVRALAEPEARVWLL